MTLKELRLLKHLTQEECAKIAGVSLRTYKSYENDTSLMNKDRYKAIFGAVENHMGAEGDDYLTRVKTGKGLIPFPKPDLLL